MDEVEVQGTPGSTATEIVGGSGTLQRSTLQEDSSDGSEKGADTPLRDDSEHGASSDNGRREDEAGTLLLPQGPADDDLESERAGPTAMLGGGVDGTAPEAPTYDPSGNSSATTRTIDNPRETIQASLSHEEDGSVPDHHAHEKEALSSLEPVGHLEHEVASTPPETSVTEENSETATSPDMAAPKKILPEGEEGIVLHEQQTDAVSELSAAATDIHEEPARSGINSTVESSEAVVEENAVQTSEGPSGSDSGTPSTSTREGGVLASSTEDASGRENSIVAESGSEGVVVGDSGASEGGVELLPSVAAAGEELLAGGAFSSGVVSTSRTSTTQESAAGFAVSQASTGDVLQPKPDSKDSRVALTLEGAGVGCTLGDPAHASHILIEAVVAKYLSLAVAEAVAVVVAVPEADVPAPDEMSGNRLASRGSSSALEEKQDDVSAFIENVVEPPEPGSLPVSDDVPDSTEVGVARGDDGTSSVKAVASQVSVESIVVHDYLEQTLPITTMAEIAAKATLRDRSLAPERGGVICLDEAVKPTSEGGVSGKGDEAERSGLTLAEDPEAKSLRPDLAEDREGGGIEKVQREGVHDRSQPDSQLSEPGSQFSENARTLVDEVIAQSLVTVAAVVTARVRDASYGCASPAPKSLIQDPCVPLCKSSLEDKCSTEGTQTPRTLPSESASTGSVSCQDRDNTIESELSPSTPYGAESLRTSDIADGGAVIGPETPQVGAPLTPEGGESTAEHMTEPRLGGIDNGLAELSSQQDDRPAAENSAPAEELEWRPSASAAIDDGVYITNADTGTIDCERFVPIPDSPISAETRAAADYVEHVVREATSAAFRAQGVGKTTSDTSGSLSTTAQVQPQRITRDSEIITSSEEESPAVLATSAEVDDGEEAPIDADGGPAVANLNDQEVPTDSGNLSLPLSGSSQASADADSLVGASGSAVAARDATALGPAARSVPSDPSPNGDEPFAGASGTDSEHEQGIESSGPPPTEPAACPAAAAALEPGVDRAADTAMPVTIESAGDLPPTPIGQEVPADPPLLSLSPSIEDPCCSSALLPDSSDGGEVHSPEIPTVAQEVQSTSEDVPVGLHACCRPCSSTALRCRVVDDFLSEKLCEMVAAETASQVSANTIEPRLHDEHRHSGEVEGHSGVDQRLAEGSGDAARSPPLRVEQGTPGEEVLGSIDQEDDKLLPDASQGVSRGQLTPPSTDTLSCIPPANEAEDGLRPSPPEEELAPTLSSSTPPSVQGHDSSSSGRSDDPTDGEVRSSQTPTAPEVVENSSTEARVSSDASNKTSPPASLRYKVVTGCLSDEISEAVAMDAVVSSISSRACDLEPATGLRGEAGVNSGANDDRPSSASLRSEVVTGLLSDEVRGGVAADAAVPSISSRACGLETSTSVRSEARVGGDTNDKPPPPASSRYVVVTGCLSDEVRGVVAADMVASSGTSGARGLDSATGVPGEARIGSDTVERDQAEERGDAVGPLESPAPQDTPQQDLSNSIRPEVEINPEPTPKSAETPPPRSSTETLDNDSSTIYHPDDPIGAGTHQLETLETAAVQGEEVEERISQGLSGVSPSSVSLLRDAVVANYLADKLREIVVAGMASSVSCSTRCDLGLVPDAQIDQPTPSAPPGGVLDSVPAASKIVVSNSENSAREDDANLNVHLPFAETAEAEQLPADQIEPSLPDEKQQSREAQAESGAEGDGGKEGSEDAQPTATPMPPPTVLEKTSLRSAEPDNESESTHPLVNVEPLASAAEILSCPQEAEAQTKALEAGVAEDRADAVAWLAGVGSTAKSMQAKASEDRAGAVAWLHNLGQQETRVQGVRLDASAWLREAGEEAQTKALEAGAADDRADAAAWLAGVGGTAKSMQAKASEDRAGAVAWLHNVGEQETRVQGIRLDASAWLRETGEKEVSLQDKAEEARFDAVEWLTTKGAAELQRTKPTERPGTASQHHLNGDGVDKRTRTDSTASDKDTAEPYLQVSEKHTSGDRNCAPTASSEQQPSELSTIDVAREAGEETFSEDTVHPELDNKVPSLCPAESHRIEDDLAAITHPLPCRSAVSVIGDPDVKVPVDRPSLGDWSAPPPCLETTSTARVPPDDAVVNSELDPQESSQMLAVGENDWSRVSLSRTPPFDALNSPSIALRWEPAGKQTRSLPPDIGGFDSTASSATIADKVAVSGSAAASTAAAVAGVSGYVAVPSNNVGSEWVGFFAPPHRMAPTGDAYGADSVCSAEASASSTARRNSTGSTLPSYVSGETGDGRIPRGYDDRGTIDENEEHLERGGAGCGARGAESWMSPQAGPRRNGDCKRWNKTAERSRRYARRWQSFLGRVHRHFDSEVQLRKKLSVIRRAHPDVSNEVAFVALAQSHGRASEAAAVLHLSRAKEEATLVTTMLDVAYFIRLTREAADARRRSLQIEEHQPTPTSKPQGEVVRRAHDQGRDEKQQQQQQQQHSHPTHHLQQWEHRRERAEQQQRQREGSFLSSDSVGFGGLSDGSTDANLDANGREVGVTPEGAGEMLDRGRRRRLRGRPVPTGINHSRRRMWSRGSESSPALLPPIARLTDGTPPTPETLKTVLATSTSVALEIPEGFGLTAEFGKSIKRGSDQGHAIKGTKRAQRAVLRARARFQRQRMAEIAAPTAHQNGSGLDAVTERFLLETGTLHRDSRDLNDRLRAPKRDPWGQGTLVYGDQIVGGSGHKGAHSSSALLASLDTAQRGESAGFSGTSPSNTSAETAVGCGDRESCRVQNYFTQALAEDGFYRGKRRGRGGEGRAVAGSVRAPRK